MDSDLEARQHAVYTMFVKVGRKKFHILQMQMNNVVYDNTYVIP